VALPRIRGFSWRGTGQGSARNQEKHADGSPHVHPKYSSQHPEFYAGRIAGVQRKTGLLVSIKNNRPTSC
jgi:hypothetical protein